jgi:HAD superfamily hydrolase (TIGR01509 family)
MKIKLIIFDLDGVLVNTKNIHFESLNRALVAVAGTEFVITDKEHVSKYDGLKTRDKLRMLTLDKGLPVSTYDGVWNVKQEYTAANFETIPENPGMVRLFRELRGDGYLIACCTNSISSTAKTALSRLGIDKDIDLILSNEDVSNGKPSPEIFWKAMSKLNALPEETIIVEDSPNGLMAAHRAGCNVVRVADPTELTQQMIEKTLSRLRAQPPPAPPRWIGGDLNILIPMAGAGSRFEKEGYHRPKPLIEVGDVPMIKLVVDNINVEAKYIFLVLKSHNDRFNLSTILPLVAPGCKVIEVDGITEGAACTALLARDLIDSDSPLLVANSDQFVEWNSNEFMYKMVESDADGGILTFKASHPKWSFARVDNHSGLVSEVAEKNPISDDATVGIYYWKKGSDFVRYADDMIRKDIRVNNEFYVCPVFNEAIKDGKRILASPARRMWGLGTPEDLEYFKSNYGKDQD